MEDRMQETEAVDGCPETVSSGYIRTVAQMNSQRCTTHCAKDLCKAKQDHGEGRTVGNSTPCQGAIDSL